MIVCFPFQHHDRGSFASQTHDDISVQVRLSHWCVSMAYSLTVLDEALLWSPLIVLIVHICF